MAKVNSSQTLRKKEKNLKTKLKRSYYQGIQTFSKKLSNSIKKDIGKYQEEKLTLSCMRAMKVLRTKLKNEVQNKYSHKGYANKYNK